MGCNAPGAFVVGWHERNSKTPEPISSHHPISQTLLGALGSPSRERYTIRFVVRHLAERASQGERPKVSVPKCVANRCTPRDITATGLTAVWISFRQNPNFGEWSYNERKLRRRSPTKNFHATMTGTFPVLSKSPQPGPHDWRRGSIKKGISP